MRRLNMPRITKAQARRRLIEAQNKINLVMFVPDLNLSKGENAKLLKTWDDLQYIISKLK